MGDLKKKLPADRVKGLLSVVIPALGLVRGGKGDTQGLQRLFLLGAKFAVFVLAVKDMTLMDMRCPLVQMERPVQNMDVRTEAFFKFLVKFTDHRDKGFR